MENDLFRYFRSLVGIHLEPLTKVYGLRLSYEGNCRAPLSPDWPLIKYESATVFVELWFDCTRSFEVDVYVGPNGAVGRPWHLSEIEAISPVLDSQFCSWAQCSTIARLDEFIPRIAKTLLSCADSLLRGNSNSFQEFASRIGASRGKELRAAEKESTLLVADQCWKNRCFMAFAALAGPYESELSAVQLARLNYARRQSAK